MFIIIWMVIVNFLTLRKVLKYHELQTAEMQMKLLRKRIDPYFIGKLLQSLNGLFYKGKKAEINEVMHQIFRTGQSQF